MGIFKKFSRETEDKPTSKLAGKDAAKKASSNLAKNLLSKAVNRKNGGNNGDNDELDGIGLEDKKLPTMSSPRAITKIPDAPTKERNTTDNTEEMKRSPAYSDEVMLRLVNLIYDPLATMLFEQAGIRTDEAHLLSLTRINSSREAAYWAQQIAKEAAYNKYVKHHPCQWPISQVWRIAFLLARRSIPGTCGPGFMLGVGLAQEQSITKSEEAGEEGDWS